MKKQVIWSVIKEEPQFGVSPISYYRQVQPLEKIREHGMFDVQMMTQRNLYKILSLYIQTADKYLLGKDIYVLSRTFSEVGVEEFIKSVHREHGVVVFDTDDDLTDDHRDLGRGEAFKKVLKFMDVVTVSTPYLAHKLEPYAGKRCIVLPNHIDFDWFSDMSMRATRKAEGLSVGFLGTASHYDDWRFPLDALLELRKEYDITIAVGGYLPDYLAEVEGVFHMGFMPYARYPFLMRQFDIVCCSLDDSDLFNHSKSAIKALEAMASARMLGNHRVGGAVPVCTDMKVYRRVVNGKNGLLTSNTEWYSTLKGLIEDDSLRNRIAEYGHKWVKKNRNAKTGYRLWYTLYRRLRNGIH